MKPRIWCKQRWYTYTLRDPRNGEVFYVGKGRYRRICHHEYEANDPKKHSRKVRRIREIKAAGQEVQYEIVAWFQSEAAAYSHEAELMARFANLTNVLPAGPGSHVNRATSVDNFSRQLLRLRSTRWFIAHWVRLGGPWGVRVRAEQYANPEGAHVLAYVGAFNIIAPKIWEGACRDPVARRLLESIVAEQGIDVRGLDLVARHDPSAFLARAVPRWCNRELSPI